MNSQLLDVIFGGGGVTVGATVMGFLKKSILAIIKDMLATALADVQRDVQELKERFAKETGGNSNGLRQAVNETKADVASVKEDIAHIKGQLSK